MKKHLTRVCTVILASAGLASIWCVLCLGSLSDDPHGKYAAVKFSGHAEADIIRFEAGRVRLETCCGDEDYGTYAKDSEGRWIWTYQYQLRPSSDHSKWHLSTPHLFNLRRSLFNIHIESIEPPVAELSMRTRLFNDIPF
jgi:hypothetical protein